MMQNNLLYLTNVIYLICLKKITTISFISLTAISFSFAQTLKDVTNDYIINPSFESYNYCPDSGLTLYSIYSCYGWYRPTQGTSDYYHPCGAINITTTPVFWSGYQNAYDGVAYCGFHGALGDSWFEYIQSKLLNKLIVNSIYKYSMRIT
jgi:hypothetical protein